jgi:hypothetical protein
MELIIISAVVFFLGWKASEAWHLIAFRKLMEDLNITNDQLVKVARDNGIDLTEKAEPDKEDQEPHLVVDVRLEQLDGVILAYRKSDDQFLAQGPDRESLIQRLTENLTPCRVVIAKEDGADLIS